ncbi:MAG: NADH-quinone oxidoreductase subunit J [Armatimonadetes bacterium]|nr:NADH-quinone oxidoreductase subunit J [Armatimonadota bacterium]
MSGEKLAFLVLALVAGAGALGVVVFGKNPVRSALSLVLNFFVLAFVYFTLGAQLLGITQIMVYAGAIMVLFLFVIMMLQLHHGQKDEEKRDWKAPVAWGFGLAMGAVIFSKVVTPFSDSVKEPYSVASPQAVVASTAAPSGPSTPLSGAQGPADRGPMVRSMDDLGKPQAVGAVLFSTYSWPFEVTSVLLLIGVVGSILLAKRRI